MENFDTDIQNFLNDFDTIEFTDNQDDWNIIDLEFDNLDLDDYNDFSELEQPFQFEEPRTDGDIDLLFDDISDYTGPLGF